MDKPLVLIIVGSKSDLGAMEDGVDFLKQMRVPYRLDISSAHRHPDKTASYARNAKGEGIEVIIAMAGLAAHLPGVIAAMTVVPVIGVPIKASLEGLDSLLAIVQMPPGIPVATVGINAAQNAAILSAEILATGDDGLHQKLIGFKENLKKKIVKANEELASVKYKFKVG